MQFDQIRWDFDWFGSRRISFLTTDGELMSAGKEFLKKRHCILLLGIGFLCVPVQPTRAAWTMKPKPSQEPGCEILSRPSFRFPIRVGATDSFDVLDLKPLQWWEKGPLRLLESQDLKLEHPYAVDRAILGKIFLEDERTILHKHFAVGLWPFLVTTQGVSVEVAFKVTSIVEARRLQQQLHQFKNWNMQVRPMQDFMHSLRSFAVHSLPDSEGDFLMILTSPPQGKGYVWSNPRLEKYNINVALRFLTNALVAQRQTVKIEFVYAGSLQF